MNRNAAELLWAAGPRAGAQDAGRRAQDAGRRAQDAGRRTRGAGRRTRGAGRGARLLGAPKFGVSFGNGWFSLVGVFTRHHPVDPVKV